MGPQGVRQFHKLRQDAIKKATGEEGDYFHDGRQVLAAVRDWHHVVRSALRKTDTATGQLLDLVDRNMLLESVEARVTAENVCVALRQLANRIDAESRLPMTEGIMKALLEMDERAASAPNPGQALTIPQYSKFRKSSVFDLTEMKTAHRSEYLKSALKAESAERQASKSRDDNSFTEVAQQAERSPSFISRPEPTPLHHTRTGSQPQDATHSQSSAVHHVPPNTSTTPLSSPASRPLIRKTLKTRSPQNMFQAREAIKLRESESREKHRITGYLRKPEKDALLSSHFKNRDIVGLLAMST